MSAWSFPSPSAFHNVIWMNYQSKSSPSLWNLASVWEIWGSDVWLELPGHLEPPLGVWPFWIASCKWGEWMASFWTTVMPAAKSYTVSCVFQAKLNSRFLKLPIWYWQSDVGVKRKKGLCCWSKSWWLQVDPALSTNAVFCYSCAFSSSVSPKTRPVCGASQVFDVKTSK